MVHCGSAFEPGAYLITAPPSVCVSAVHGALAVWIHHQTKKKVQLAEQPTRLTLSWSANQYDPTERTTRCCTKVLSGDSLYLDLILAGL